MSSVSKNNKPVRLLDFDGLVGKRYRHYKGGLYEIIGLEAPADNLSDRSVVYKSMKDGVVYQQSFDRFFEILPGLTNEWPKLVRFTPEG